MAGRGTPRPAIRAAGAVTLVLLLSFDVRASAAEGPSSASGAPAPAFVSVAPAGGWRLHWLLGHRVERRVPGAPWLEHVADHLTAGLELTRQLAWQAGGVTWKAEASVRAVAARRRERLTDLFGGSVEDAEWASAAWLSRLSLAAFRSDPASGHGVEVAASLFFQGPPDSAPTPIQSVGLTLSRVMDPAIVAVSTALTAGSGYGAALSSAGEWRVVVTDQLAIFTGASASWAFDRAALDVRTWTGVSLSFQDGVELGVSLEHPVDGRGEFVLQMGVLLPGLETESASGEGGAGEALR